MATASATYFSVGGVLGRGFDVLAKNLVPFGIISLAVTLPSFVYQLVNGASAVTMDAAMENGTVYEGPSSAAAPFSPSSSSWSCARFSVRRHQLRRLSGDAGPAGGSRRLPAAGRSVGAGRRRRGRRRRHCHDPCDVSPDRARPHRRDDVVNLPRRRRRTARASCRACRAAPP